MGHRIPLVLLVLGTPACQSEEVACDCMSQGLSVSAEGVQVAALELSGPACTTPVVTSQVDGSAPAGNGFVPGARSYNIMPNAEGDCTLTVSLADGSRQEKTVQFYRIAGRSCCNGLYVNGSPQWALSSGAPADGAAD